nr:MAG TPA: hypothetical protein [Caudoviricetes sp.]
MSTFGYGFSDFRQKCQPLSTFVNANFLHKILTMNNVNAVNAVNAK